MKFATVFNKILSETTIKVFNYKTGTCYINEMTIDRLKSLQGWTAIYEDLKNRNVKQFRLEDGIDGGILIIEVI